MSWATAMNYIFGHSQVNPEPSSAAQLRDETKLPKIQRGAYDSVQNFYVLNSFFLNDGKEWVLNSPKGPFRALGENKIHEIAAGSAPELVVGRLNNALITLNRSLYQDVQDWIPKDEPFPKLPAFAYANFTRLSDCKGESLLVKGVRECLDHPEKLSKIGELLDLGIKINKPVRLMVNIDFYNIPPLTAAWLMISTDERRVGHVIQVANYLLEKGADINQVVDGDGNNILGSLGLDFDGSELFKWYLNNKGFVNFQNNKGQTFLHQLAKETLWTESGILEIANALIKAGADLKIADKEGHRVIHIICKQAQLLVNNHWTAPGEGFLKCILQHAPDERYHIDGHGHSCVYLCSAAGNIPLLKIILDQWDEKKGFPDAPRMLLKSVCEANAVAGYSVEKQHEVLESISLPIIKLLLPYLGSDQKEIRESFTLLEEGTTPLHELARTSPWLPEALVQADIIKKEDLEVIDGRGITVTMIVDFTKDFCALYDACFALDEKAIGAFLHKFEIPAGLPVSGDFLLGALLQGLAQQYDSEKPMPIEQQTCLLSKLLNFGIDPNCVLSDGSTPLVYVAKKCDLFCIYPLLNYGASPVFHDNACFDIIQGYIDQDPDNKEEYQIVLDTLSGAVQSF